MSTHAARVRPFELVPTPVLRLASDRRLVEQTQAGSERAFEVFFDRHRGPLLAFCHRFLGSHEEAEDVVQQAFLVVYDELMHGASPRAPRPWLYGIARHRCLTVLRARRHCSIEEVPEAAIDHLATSVMTREELRAIFSDMARLPDDQRTALALAELGNIPYAEIARLLGCRPEKVKALVYQARSALVVGRSARETPCAEIREQLATLRGGALRRASLRRHIRHCADCRAFREELRRRRVRLGVLLPDSPIVALKRGILGVLSGGGGEGGGTVAAMLTAVSGPGLAATALVTVALPIGCAALATGALRHRAEAPTAATDRPWTPPAHAAPHFARAESLVAGRGGGASSAAAGKRADARPDVPARRTTTSDTPRLAPLADGVRGGTDHVTDPGQRAPEEPPGAPAAAGSAASPSGEGGGASDAPSPRAPSPIADTDHPAPATAPTPGPPPRAGDHPAPATPPTPGPPPRAGDHPAPAVPTPSSESPPVAAPSQPIGSAPGHEAPLTGR